MQVPWYVLSLLLHVRVLSNVVVKSFIKVLFWFWALGCNVSRLATVIAYNSFIIRV